MYVCPEYSLKNIPPSNSEYYMVKMYQMADNILTCLLLNYCNKLTEDLFCLAEKRNNCLSKKVVFFSIDIYIYIYIYINQNKIYGKFILVNT